MISNSVILSKEMCSTVIYDTICTLYDLNRQNKQQNLTRSYFVIAITAYIADVNKLAFTIVP